MNFARLEEQICRDEGYRASPYLDTVEVPTIGYGTTRILGRPVSMNDPPLPEPIARHLLRADLYLACMDAQDLFETFGELNAVRREVLVNMAYNVGKTRLSRFENLIEAVDNLDYEEAALQMEQSRWFRQVKQRGIRLRDAMLTGEW